jgi:hypothetical protein
MALVASVIPPPSVSERRAALAAACRHALSRGVTTLVDMGRYLPGDERGPWLDLQVGTGDCTRKLRCRAKRLGKGNAWGELSGIIPWHELPLPVRVMLGAIYAVSCSGLHATAGR